MGCSIRNSYDVPAIANTNPRNLFLKTTSYMEKDSAPILDSDPNFSYTANDLAFCSVRPR